MTVRLSSYSQDLFFITYIEHHVSFIKLPSKGRRFLLVITIKFVRGKLIYELILNLRQM